MNTQIQSKNPYVSVLICSLNGGNRIGECFFGLDGQTYGRENFEVIVVDDGSTDDTSEVARKHGARVIRFEKNKGIPVARNAALSAANTEIVVFIDDDCVPDARWIGELISVFKDEKIVAAGGKILALSRETVAERYMEATGYGNPARAPKDVAGGLRGRLFAYFTTMTSPIMFEKEAVDVFAVYTANAAYRRKSLLKLGGFDESLKTNEDSDMSARLLADGGRIVYMPRAVVRHRHYKKLFKVIYEAYSRAQYTLKFYLKERKIPPIFPLPVLYLFSIFASFLLLYDYPVVFFLIRILLPVVLYSWWIVRGVREGRLEYVLYPYIQLVIESAVIFGLLKGVFRKIERRNMVK